MQLSSVLLAATALLAHTSSGFRLVARDGSGTEASGLSPPDIAEFAIVDKGFVGYEEVGSEEGRQPLSNKPVDIVLVGSEIQTDYVFRQESSEPGLWVLKTRDDQEIAGGELTGPFEVTGENLFEWAGDSGDARWLICENKPEVTRIWSIHLSKDGKVPTDVECHDVDLIAEV